ncbi:MAG: DUF3549 family protein [Gammaproteobacteria bacterium]|nr:DUF3549 family protein [Gammaproteobacteria bacterium]
MSTITSLLDFFEQSNIRCRIFDMGRRVVPLGKQAFGQFEQGKATYPYPLQNQAWLGLLCWPGDDTARHFIWFLRLPLDETGHVSYAARDDLLSRLAQMAESGLSGDDSEEVQQPLEENPYGFKPTEDRMAVFHAKALKALGLPPSKFYEHARDYFDGKTGFDQWAFVGMQGIADLAARVDEEDNAQCLAKAVPGLPEAPFEALAKCLENEPIPTVLSEAIAAHMNNELNKDAPNPTLLSLGLRALALAPAQGLRRELMQNILKSSLASDINILVAISGRSWEDLLDKDLRKLYLEALANNAEGQAVFNRVLVDLFFIDGMREPIMTSLRDPERSDTLASAIGKFFAALRQ